MTSARKAPQKLISFTDNTIELERIKKEMDEGWAIISLVKNANLYTGIMEKIQYDSTVSNDQKTVYIPPRKKIKISG